MNPIAIDRPAPTVPAAAPQEPAEMPARHDMYAFIHKALRRLLCDTLVRVGRLDDGDAAESAATLGQLEAMLALMQGHLEHENRYVHPALEARRPGTSARIGAEHEEHLETIEALQAELQALRAAPAERRPLLSRRLYRHLTLFVAENLQHMHVEETVHNAALWEGYTDAELVAIEDALRADIPEAEMAQVLRWMVPALTPAERAEMLVPMQAAIPPEAFRGVLEIVRPTLDDLAWAKLARALNVPPAPGLVQV